MTGTGYALSRRQQALRRDGDPRTRFAVLVPDGVDQDAAVAAVAALAARHGALRTRFETRGQQGGEVQVLADADPARWRTLAPAIDADAAAEALDDDQETDVDDLSVTWVPLTGGGAVLGVDVSAAAADLASAALFARQLGLALADGLPDDPVPDFLQYSEWERSQGDPGDGRPAVSGTRSARRLPVDRLTSGVTGRRTTWAVLPEEVVADCRRRAGDAGRPLADVFAAAWARTVARADGNGAVHLLRWSDERPEQLQQVIGPFATPYAAAVDSGAERSELLDQVSAPAETEPAEGAYVFRVVTDAGPLLRATTDGDADGSGLTVVESDAGVRVGFSHHVDLDLAVAQLVLVRYQTALKDDEEAADVVAEEECRLLAEAAGEAPGGDGEPAPEAPAALVLARLAEQVQRTPLAVAVRRGEEELSYADLWARAGVLAVRLRAAGVGRGDLCAVWVPSGPTLLEAVLAVLRNDAGYLPLDTEWPAERVSALLEQAVPRCLVTVGSLADELSGDHPEVLRLDQPGGADEPVETAEPPASTAGRDDLAYVIFTSGSTGRPKGVMVTQGGLAVYLDWATRTYPPGGSVLAHASVAADMAVTSLFVPLMTGGTVVFPAESGLDGLIHAIERTTEPWSFSKLTPTHLRLLEASLPTSVKASFTDALIVGGEELTPAIVAPWLRARPDRPLYNEYGPTETVVGCCVERVSLGDLVPIGRPVAGARLYVLDDQLRQRPFGTVGELFIGGPGVARGYLGRPDLTAERFLPDPFGPPGSRLYRTGDLVHLSGDSRFVYQGRVDDQEQIGGFRVEPAEVDLALQAHPEVASGAAGVLRGDDGTVRLVAAVVAQPDQELRGEQVRRYLRKRLPAYLVPSRINVVTELPTTSSGKLDRQAIARGEHAAGRAGASAGAGAPAAVDLGGLSGPQLRGKIQQVVTAAWAEALGSSYFDPDDNFFDLGGTSFMLLDLAVRLQQDLGHEIGVITLLENPTVGSLSGVLFDAAEQLVHADGAETADPGDAAGPGLGGPDGTADQPASDADRRRQALQQARLRAENRAGE